MKWRWHGSVTRSGEGIVDAETEEDAQEFAANRLRKCTPEWEIYVDVTDENDEDNEK